MALLNNVTLHWARLAQPEKKYMSEETQWSVNAQIEDKVSRKFVKDKLTTKERWMQVEGEDVPYIKFTRSTHYKKSGDERAPVRVVDKYGKTVDSAMIGNGTAANVQYSVRDWEFQGRKGKSVELLAVQITNLIEKEDRSAGSEFDFVDEKEVSLEDVNLDDDEFE
jgi:hypothetical protein